MCRANAVTPATSRLGLGLASLGRPAYINLGRENALPAKRSIDEMRAASWDVLDSAHAAGVQWIDVARSYGRAEEFLADWLSTRGHNDVTISSKWGYTYLADWRVDAGVHEVKEHSLVQFHKQLAETQGLLGDRLSLYQVHSLTADSPLFANSQLLAALVERAPAWFSTSGPGAGGSYSAGMSAGG
jgi:aryl-alcohol dehydrogenase-like predicted oxidoreductase